MSGVEEQSLAKWAFYDFFSKVLYQPEQDMLEHEFQQLLKEANNEYQAINPELVADFCQLVDHQLSLQELLVEYGKLFVGPAEVLAPPYESYYRDSGTVMGASTIGVKKFYQKTGMEMLKEIKEPPDHIAIEMNFLAQLFRMQTQLLEDQDTDRAEQIMTLAAEFYLKHPAVWIEEFCNRVRQKSQHEFYILVAKMLLEFHNREMQYYSQVAFSN